MSVVAYGVAYRELIDASLKNPQALIDAAKSRFDRGEELDLKYSGTEKSLRIYSQVISKKENRSILYAELTEKTGKKVSFAERSRPFIEFEQCVFKAPTPNGDSRTPLLS